MPAEGYGRRGHEYVVFCREQFCIESAAWARDHLKPWYAARRASVRPFSMNPYYIQLQSVYSYSMRKGTRQPYMTSLIDGIMMTYLRFQCVHPMTQKSTCCQVARQLIEKVFKGNIRSIYLCYWPGAFAGFTTDYYGLLGTIQISARNRRFEEGHMPLR